jgi:hypothetical protein
VALAFVQVVKIAASSGSSITVGITPAAGSLLAAGALANVTQPTVSSSVDGAFTRADASTANANDVQGGLFYKANATAGAHTLTFAGGGFPGGVCYEVSGADTTAPFDAAEDGSAEGTGTTATSASVAVGAEERFVLNWVPTESGTNPQGFTPAGGWTQPANGFEVDGGIYFPYTSAYKIGASLGTVSHAYGISPSCPWASILAAFEVAAGAAAKSRPGFPRPLRVWRGRMVA